MASSPLPPGVSTASFGVQRSTFRGTRFAHVSPVATAAAAYRLGVSRLLPEGGGSSNWKRNGGVFVRCRRLEVHEAEKMAEEEELRKPLRVGVICGGPSAERGISLNSARSVLDHIQGDDVHVLCYYIDMQLNAYAISPAQLYSNTPADFDFKLESLAQGFRSLPEFTEHLSHSVDIAFPVIHGRFGEDGGIQELLERANVPFIGTPSRECRKAFDKYEASQELSRQGFVTVPNFLVKKGELNTCELHKWFSSNQLDKDMGKVVVKPARSGSSIGVTVAYGIEDAIRKASNIISEGTDDKVLIEVFLEGGSEFTAIILDVGTASDRHPVVLLPTEVELQSLDSSNSREETIFDYRKKYLPTQQVAYHTPPRFPSGIIQHIREGAALLFKYFGLRDFARIDGWFFPSTPHLLNSNENIKFGKVGSGTIIYTDVNLVSGMEQTSFLFQQASKVGFSHSSILHTIIQHACLRFPSLSVYSNTQSASSRKTSFSQNVKTFSKSGSVRKVFVIFGGETSERQVSLMSGTNVWLNLQSFDDLEVTPCLLAPENGYSACNHDEDEAFGEIPRIVWSLPYSIVLRHTTEEVFSACLDAVEPARATLASQLCREVMSELEEGLNKCKRFSGFDISNDLPMKFSLDEWIRHAKDTDAIVFIAVHGGIGEDGSLQSSLEAAGVPYTGPGPMASKICMDKVSTSLSLDHLKSSGVLTIPKVVMSKEELLKGHTDNIWCMLTAKLHCETVCVKPTRDGCSTGVARLCSSEDLSVYTKAIRDYLLRLPPNMLSKAHGVIEMPNPPPKSLIFEPFIETDEVLIPSKSTNCSSHQLLWKGQSKWIEVTVGVIGKLGEMHSLSPSITVKEISDILSLEEKFQGGTGINLTPPPTAIINQEALQRCKHRIELIAHTLRLQGFSRIDAFVNVHSGEVLVIEVNTIPGMTPSTALIHQALAEEPPMYPREFFRKVLDLALQRSSRLLRASAVESED